MNSRKSKPPLSTRPSNDRLAARWVREWLLVAAALLMLGGGIGWSLYHDRQELEGEERERLSRRASMIDENIRRQLFATNRALESIRRDLPLLKRQKDSTGLINDRLQALVEVMPGVRTLLVYDADATVIASNRKELIGRNFRERDFVKAALQSRNPAVLHLSAPYTTALGAFAMTAVKLIADDRGQVLGMVGVSVDPDYFKTLLHSVIYAPDMRVSITHSDGRLFATVPEQAGRQGADLAQPGSFFTRHRDSGQQETLLTGIAYITGDERMMALRTIQLADLLMDKTLLVSVARDLPAIFADWRKDAYEKAALFGLLALIASVGLFLNQRRQRAYARVVASGEVERQLAAQALQGTQDLLARAEELGRVGGWEFDVETGQQTWTKAVYDIHELDFTLHPTVSQSINFYTPDSRPIIEQAVQRALEQGEPFDLELEIVTAKGNLRYVHAVGRTDLARRKVSGFIQDITERKQAEARSYESENRRISEQAAALEAERRAGLAALHLMEDAVSARTRAETMTATLAKQLDELHRWQQLTLGREGRILAMKQEVNSLLAELGQQARYASAADAETPK
jgi:PAS domain-containing protein